MVISSKNGEEQVATTGQNVLTRVQLFKYVTRDRILEVSDMLSLESKRSKLAVTLVEFNPESHRAQARVRHFVDATDFKLVCWDILNGLFTEWTDHKGSPTGDGIQARVLTLRKDVKYRQPYVLKIDNGEGETMNGGAVKMIQATDSLTLLMPEFDARRMAMTILDYIRDWETVNFRRRQEAQTVVIPLAGTAVEPAPIAEPEPTPAPRRRTKVAA
jgi:hypothetical protein